MKQNILQLIVLVIVVSTISTPVFAVTNHGLYWGISAGQRFDYKTNSVQRIAEDTNTTTVDWYLIVDSLGQIPDDVSTFADIYKLFQRTSYYMNGTEITPFQYIWFAYPIGNWNLVLDLLVSNPSETETIDNETAVGFVFRSESDNTTYIYSEIYQRSTGALLRYYTSINDTNWDFYSSTEIVLIASSSPTQLLFGFAVIGIVSIVIIGTLLKKRF